MLCNVCIVLQIALAPRVSIWTDNHYFINILCLRGGHDGANAVFKNLMSTSLMSTVTGLHIFRCTGVTGLHKFDGHRHLGLAQVAAGCSEWPRKATVGSPSSISGIQLEAY